MGVTFFSGLGFMLRNFIFPVNKSVPLKHFFKAGSDKKLALCCSCCGRSMFFWCCLYTLGMPALYLKSLGSRAGHLW